MIDKQRKLLPYEHQMIDALGITKEEYLDFVVQQHTYNDIKQGGVLDVTNSFAAVAIVLTIVGTLFQVAGALLAPKPKAQQAAAGQAATRDEIFAPRFGFNNAQQLASYGDPVNLIYTNKIVNPDGGVRAATALIWSGVQSYGNSQLVQLLFVIGAGGVDAIDEKISAFGQTSLRDLVAQNYWTYFAPGSTGQLRNDNLRPDSYGQLKSQDPTKYGDSYSNPYKVRVGADGTKAEGFSHAYSPTASNTFGAYGAVPINVKYFIRNESGNYEAANNLITMTDWRESLTAVSTNQNVRVTLSKVTRGKGNLAFKDAEDSRQSLSTVFDSSGIFKFGSVKMKLTSANRTDVIEGDMDVNFITIEDGKGSVVPYTAYSVEDLNLVNLKGQGSEHDKVRNISNALTAEDQRTRREDGVDRRYTARELSDEGNIYTIQSVAIPGRFLGGHQMYEQKVAFFRNLTDAEISALERYAQFEDENQDTQSKDDYFFLKSIARVEEASYETVSLCNIVDFSIKTKVFKRISGRQEEYGSNKVKGYSTSDNGTKARTSMFLVKFKRATDAKYRYVPGIFIVRRSADIDNFVYLRFNGANLDAAHWQFKFEPVIDPLAEFAAHPELVESGDRLYHYLENSGNSVARQLPVPYSQVYLAYSGTTRKATGSGFPPINSSPNKINEWDLFSNTSDNQIQFSFDNGPEFALAAVTEQIVTPFSNFPGLYLDLSLFGLNMYSGKSVQDLRSFTVFVTQGRRTRLLKTSGTVNGRSWGQYALDTDYLSATANGNANTAPDIFIDTILDVNDGIGKYATLESTNLEQLARSKKFCEVNELFMDCIIAEPTSWRSFWATNAAFSLLELAKIGGQDVLVPGVPYNKNTGKITTAVPIAALFNQGNILAGTYKEEFIDYGSNTQDVIVTAIYRTLDSDSTFSRNTSVDVQLTDAIEENAIRETIDMSAFVTKREQAILVSKFLCQTKRYSQKAIDFKTFPTDSPVFPGAYIYVELAQNQWDRIYTGIIESGGFLNTALNSPILDGTYSALCYLTTNQGTAQVNNVQVVNGKAESLLGYEGHLFVLGTSVRNRRVFRVTEVLMDEEGEVTVKGIRHNTDENGNSLISNGLAQRVPGLFTIDGQLE